VKRLADDLATTDGDSPDVLTPATRLARENARLDGIVQAGLAEVQASRRRIVTLADNERRRIERDLHDGAQQRLVSATFHLRVAMPHVDAEEVDGLIDAERRLKEALSRLRDLAHGSALGVLAEQGLHAALEDLAAAATVPTALDVPAGSGAPPDVERAVVVAVAAALDNVARHARAASARVSVLRTDAILRVHVSDDGAGGATIGSGLTEVADRVGAAGGALRLVSPVKQGTLLEVELPCGS